MALHAAALGTLVAVARPERPRPATVVPIEIVEAPPSAVRRVAGGADGSGPGAAPPSQSAPPRNRAIRRRGLRGDRGTPGRSAVLPGAPSPGPHETRAVADASTTTSEPPSVVPAPDREVPATGVARPGGPAGTTAGRGTPGDGEGGGGEEGRAEAGANDGRPGSGAGGARAVTGPELEAIRARIAQAIVYPLAARRSRLQGRVVVSFIIGRDGRARDVHVVTSSGYDVLDSSAVSAVLTAGPFRHDVREASITTPILFRLDGS